MRKFRGSTYNIHVVNKAGDEKGKLSLTVDGKAIDGNVIPADKAPATHQVEVELA